MKPRAKRRFEIVAAIVVFSLLLVKSSVLAQVQLTQDYGSISGKILAKDGTPAAGVRVAAMAAQNNPTANEAFLLSVVQTDSQGRYRLERVPVGRYYITAGFLDSLTYFPGVAAQTQASVVDVTRSVSLTGKDFSIVFPTAVTVRGIVIRESGSTPANVVRFSSGTGIANTASIATDGSFQIALRPGVYDINAGSPFVFPAKLTVLDRDITDLRLEVPAVATVTGILTVENKFPAPPFQMSFTNARTGMQYLARPNLSPVRNTSADGIPFTVQLPRGDYRVTTNGLPNGYLLRSMTADSRNIMGETLSISAVPIRIAVTIGTAALPPMPKVSGRVSGGALVAQPNQNFRPLFVQLSGDATWGELSADVKPDGSFEFPAVLPGTYRMSLPRMTPNVRDVTLIVADHDLTSVVIPTPMVRNIQGKVTIEGGGTLPRFGLVYRTFHTFDTGGVGSNSASSIVSPAADGSFMAYLPEGEYEVGISSSTPAGYLVKSFRYGSTDLLNNKIKVDGDSVTLQLELAPPGSLTVPDTSNAARSIPTLRQTGYLNAAEFPSIRNKVEAQYSDEGRRNRIQGGVTLEILVRSDGSSDPDIKVIRHIGSGLDEKAIEAVRQWKFNPAVKNGAPVDARLQVEVVFRL